MAETIKYNSTHLHFVAHVKQLIVFDRLGRELHVINGENGMNTCSRARWGIFNRSNCVWIDITQWKDNWLNIILLHAPALLSLFPCVFCSVFESFIFTDRNEEFYKIGKILSKVTAKSVCIIRSIRINQHLEFAHFIDFYFTFCSLCLFFHLRGRR